MNLIVRINAPADIASTESSSDGSPLGLVPHQLRGALSRWQTLLVEGEAYDKCTGCSSIVSSSSLPLIPHGRRRR
jgi:ubiquitin-like modifier-activating enzyme ATG7